MRRSIANKCALVGWTHHPGNMRCGWRTGEDLNDHRRKWNIQLAPLTKEINEATPWMHKNIHGVAVFLSAVAHPIAAWMASATIVNRLLDKRNPARKALPIEIGCDKLNSPHSFILYLTPRDVFCLWQKRILLLAFLGVCRNCVATDGALRFSAWLRLGSRFFLLCESELIMEHSEIGLLYPQSIKNIPRY